VVAVVMVSSLLGASVGRSREGVETGALVSTDGRDSFRRGRSR
jgi:hypothetical protein